MNEKNETRTHHTDNILIFNNKHDLFVDTKPTTDSETDKIVSDQPGPDYSSVSKHDKAISMYKKNLKINEKMGDKESIHRIIYLIGDFYLKIGKYDSAMNYFHRSVEINNERNKRLSSIAALKSMAEIYLIWNEYDKALQANNEILKLQEENGRTDGIISSTNEIANIKYYCIW